MRANIDVALQYLDAWLQGTGAAAIHNLMEDAATAEISRAQLWQWIWNEAPLAEGGRVTSDLYRRLRDEELRKLGSIDDKENGRLREAANLLDELVLGRELAPFLTSLAYPLLD